MRLTARLNTNTLLSLMLIVVMAAVTGCKDADDDGFFAKDDCNDDVATINPDAPELCDGVDQDCDGAIDEDLEIQDWWIDGDGDGVGAGEITSGCSVSPPTEDHVAATGDADCDDADPANFPGNVEACDGADNDCDAEIDNGLDEDGDGVVTCGPDGTPGNADDDCDDGNAAAYPGNTELCDAFDNNCDGVIDEGFDADEDGVTTCGPDGLALTSDDDCDDTNAMIYPDAPELCDDLDNDCDNLEDEADPNYAGEDNDEDGDNSIVCGGTDCDDTDPIRNGLDQDLDGETSCETDCDDLNPTVLQAGTEFCDDLDNDCNGLVDDGVGPDGDGDGFDTSGCAFFGSDCDDTDPHVFPDGTYTSGYQKECEPAVRPGFANSWAYARLNLPTYFEDPQTGTHYLYFRGYHDPDQHQFGYVTSSDGLGWSAIQGPIFSESQTAGSWDGRRISHPSVVYIPGKPRPYLMAYHALDDDVSDRRVGIATATTADGDSDGTFKRMDLGGATVSAAVIPASPNATAVDNEQVLHPALWYDDTAQVVHMWYTGRFGSPNTFAIAHAQCDTTTSDCGDASDWVKTDTNNDGDPDIWIEGDVGGFDEGDVRQAYVHPHTSANNFFTYDLEITYSSDEFSIGAAQGDIDDATTWDKVTFNPVLSPSEDPNRMDGQSATGRGVRYDAANGEYHMYYGTSVQLPVDGNGQVISQRWGPGNFSSGASYIGHAINHEPLLAVTALDCSSAAGDIEDNAPDTVEINVYDGSSLIAGPITPDSTGNEDTGIQTTTWSVSGLGLGAGNHDLTFVVTDEGGADRSVTQSVTCP